MNQDYSHFKENQYISICIWWYQKKGCIWFKPWWAHNLKYFWKKYGATIIQSSGIQIDFISNIDLGIQMMQCDGSIKQQRERNECEASTYKIQKRVKSPWNNINNSHHQAKIHISRASTFTQKGETIHHLRRREKHIWRVPSHGTQRDFDTLAQVRTQPSEIEIE